MFVALKGEEKQHLKQWFSRGRSFWKAVMATVQMTPSQTLQLVSYILPPNSMAIRQNALETINVCKVLC